MQIENVRFVFSSERFFKYTVMLQKMSTFENLHPKTIFNFFAFKQKRKYAGILKKKQASYMQICSILKIEERDLPWWSFSYILSPRKKKFGEHTRSWLCKNCGFEKNQRPIISMFTIMTVSIYYVWYLMRGYLYAIYNLMYHITV